MTQPNVSRVVNATATSGQTVFTYSFRIYDEDDLDVYVNGELKTISTHYTVTGVGELSGGTVVFTSPQTTGAAVTLRADTEIVRSTDFNTAGAYRAADINLALDKSIAIAQEHEEALGRAIKFSASSTSANIDMPEPSAGKGIQWNSTGTGLENTTSDIADLITDATAAKEAAEAAQEAAETAETNAETAETNATTQANNAAASAATALAATVGKYENRISISDSDSPYTVPSLTQDTLITVTTTGGNVVINLPAASGEDDNRLIGIIKNGDSNTITITPDGSDTIGGAASFIQYSDTEWADLYLDKTNTDWQVGNLSFTTAGSGLSKTGSTISLDLTNDQSWTGSQRSTPVTDNDGSFDMDTGNDFVWTPSGSDTLEFTNETTGQRGVILLDNSSGYTISLGSEVEADLDAVTTLSTAGKYIIGYWCYDGTNVAISYSGAIS